MGVRFADVPALAGIPLSLAAYFLFSSSDMLVKALTREVPVFQVVLLQVAFAFIPFMLVVLRRGGFSRRIRNRSLVAIRGLLAGVNTLCGFYAFSALPLAEVYAIVFCTPIVVTLASIPVLGETVGMHRIAVIVAGFLGILVMIDPIATHFSLAHLSAFGSVLASAAVILIMRKIGKEEDRVSMVAAVLAGILLVGLPGALVQWQPLNGKALLIAAGSGFFMGVAQFVSLEALRRAPASVIAPLQYTMLVWALAYGVAIFDDPVKANVLAGALIVIAANLYNFHRERLRARRIIEA
ncbi:MULTISPECIES: DMT family transporter [unclassified Rhizobium]|uniref:DMT family transporter n=2 Tax=Rhizobium TaxID=379 RepID=UPI0007E9BF06|nr:MULTISPECIES: DMT family transporter [unclassified Rhizobium]ANM14217.1 DMT superfamily inner membrane transporter protein [Rhizobium sp. N324]ANM20601.1 DMT superfamily inner membrane transporter protein [Rhizobium sp. N541]ANM26985.1 DMT superfamily inner membrane transporter protein [Rhizobium sp. N941]OYD00390.1 DMT superfamily inner membrane transporter protein [Rhizobium sp. N4311]